MRRPKKSSPVKLPDPLTLDIVRFSHDGRGIAHHEGRVVMVSNALPGEEVVAKIDRAKSKLWQGETIRVNRVSPLRRSPECPHYLQCGGCQLQHVPAGHQLSIKQQAVVDHLHRNKISVQEWLDPLTSSEFGYRHRARFHVSRRLNVGFLKARGSDVIDIEHCPVLSAELQAVFSRVKQQAPLEGMGQFELSVDDYGQIGGVALKGTPSAINDFHQWLESQGWHWNIKLRYESGDQVVTALPGEFTQVNRSMNQVMLRQAKDWLQVAPTDRVLDLFCGNGNLSQCLSGQVDCVLGLEYSDSAILQAKESAKLNESIQYEVANLFQVNINDLPAVTSCDPTVAIIDPPRSGAENICQQLSQLSHLRRILYVSCDPATLARDISILNQDKWRLSKVSLIDMFPQTRHIETMALLEKTN